MIMNKTRWLKKYINYCNNDNCATFVAMKNVFQNISHMKVSLFYLNLQVNFLSDGNWALRALFKMLRYLIIKFTSLQKIANITSTKICWRRFLKYLILKYTPLKTVRPSKSCKLSTIWITKWCQKYIFFTQALKTLSFNYVE